MKLKIQFRLNFESILLIFFPQYITLTNLPNGNMLRCICSVGGIKIQSKWEGRVEREGKWEGSEAGGGGGASKSSNWN